jgi:hypothetical protein
MYDSFRSYDVTDYDPLEGDPTLEEVGETCFTVNWSPQTGTSEPAAETKEEPPFSEEEFRARWWPSAAPEEL